MLPSAMLRCGSESPVGWLAGSGFAAAELGDVDASSAAEIGMLRSAHRRGHFRREFRRGCDSRCVTTIVVCVEILASARKHSVSDDDIRHAVENSVVGGRSDSDSGFLMLVGPDQAGNLLEIGVVVTDDIEYAIHAMRARPRYMDWL